MTFRPELTIEEVAACASALHTFINMVAEKDGTTFAELVKAKRVPQLAAFTSALAKMQAAPVVYQGRAFQS